MVSSHLPKRLQWAVQLLDVSPDDRILEIGCGPGVAVSLVCEQLAGGKITAIDRSAAAIQRAAKRNADHLASGKAALLQIDLADLALAGQHFDKAFAINVNLFWARPAGAELRLIKELLRPGGVVHLVYQTPGEEQAGRVAKVVTSALAGHGYAAAVTAASSPSLLCVTGRPATGAGRPPRR
jgi:SAM-dependent methyltransferase